MKVVKTINRGACGRVECVELPEGQRVARKVFDPELHVLARTEREKLRARFVREVRVQSSLPTEYFLPILDSRLDLDQPWFLMPIAERNFAQEIATLRRARSPQNTKALPDILNALEELHSLGFVHRDLKPENVLLHEGTWKLSDFGFVQPPTQGTSALTSVQSGWGTMNYCAPEQAQDFSKVTAAADIYAFGCLLHDMFSGKKRVPYQRQTCDGPIGWIIEKCTEIEPQRRFRSVASLRDVLLSALADTPEINDSPEAERWAGSLEEVGTWTVAELQRFVRFFGSAKNAKQFCFTLDEPKIRAIHRIDQDLWKEVAVHICEWARGSFDFDYCDVVIRRLELIYEIGDVECKASAVVAAAVLGASHNRWYVMRRLLLMCGLGMEDRAAARTAIQIRVEEAQLRFKRCAEQLNRDIDAYHPRVRAALT